MAAASTRAGSRAPRDTRPNATAAAVEEVAWADGKESALGARESGGERGNRRGSHRRRSQPPAAPPRVERRRGGRGGDPNSAPLTGVSQRLHACLEGRS